jgi:hydroxypyruvate isomerase
MLRFAANLTMMYTEVAFLDRFAAAARDGFKAVEYMFPYEYPAGQIAALLAEHGLEQVLFNASAGDWAAGERGFACRPGAEAAFQRSIHQALEYARVLNCPRIHAMAGIAPNDVAREQLLEVYTANIAWAADEAGQQGRELVIEPINGRDMPGYFLNRQDEAHLLVGVIGRDNLKVMLDLYHVANEEEDVAAELRRSFAADRAAQVGHMQIAGFPGRHEPDTGTLDYGELFPLIEELGYKGWIGLEYRPLAGTTDGLKWMRGL